MAVSVVKRVISSSVLRSGHRWVTSLSSLNVAPQQQMALSEKCILVDMKDNIVGEASKLDCHLVKDGQVPLHRAFSVLLFNSKKELLVQQRSSEKITFPNCFTNTCCSHPLADFPKEKEEKDGLGVKIAAQRRLNHELGIPYSQAAPEAMTYITRFVYSSYEEVFGENELDYILILRGDVTLNPNPDEVRDLRYVGQDTFDSWVASINAPITPWFRLLVQKKLLHKWWDNLDNLDKLIDHKNIMNFS